MSSPLTSLFFKHTKKRLCVCKNTLWGGDVPLHSSHPDLAFLIGCLLACLLNYIREGRHGLTATAWQLERGKQEWPKQDRFDTVCQ